MPLCVFFATRVEIVPLLSKVIAYSCNEFVNKALRFACTSLLVELSRLVHVIAYTHEVEEADMKRLHSKCVDEMRHINGAVDFESVYRYQKREN